MSARQIEHKDSLRTQRGQPTKAKASPRRTRTSRAWASMTFGLAALTAVVVFCLQNLAGVRVSFLGLHGRLPLAILLLLVAVLAGLAVFAFGAARIVQLRMEARRSGKSV